MADMGTRSRALLAQLCQIRPVEGVDDDDTLAVVALKYCAA
jgi:hypothetical protein